MFILSDAISVKDAAVKAGCTRQNVYRWIDEGKLNAKKLFGVLLVSEGELIRVMNEVSPRGMPRKNNIKK